MSRKLGTIALAALCLIPALAQAAPTAVRGRFQSGLGTLELRTEDGLLHGRYTDGGPCGFDPERRVLEGDLEGDVLVGTVTVCQTGPACQEKAYPFLGFFNPDTRVVSGTVRLDEGCRSPALGAGGRLELEPLAGDGTKATAAELAKRRMRQKRNAQKAVRPFELGQKLLQDGSFAAAAQQFHRALSYDERHWPALLALGVAEFKLGRVQNALRSYERSRQLKPDFADTYYNIACVHARLGDRKLSLENLRRAVLRYGFAEPEFMSSDPDLTRLLKDDPEFTELVRQAQDRKSRHAHPTKRGRSGRP